MALTQNNKPLMHRKEWQMMTIAPTATVAGALMITDDDDQSNVAMYLASNAAAYLYHHDEDAWVQVASATAPFTVGTFGASTCGDYHPWSSTYACTASTSTTITVAAGTHNLTGYVKDKIFEVRSGTRIGERGVITGILTNNGTGNIVLTVTGLSGAMAASDTFTINSGRFFVANGASTAAGSFRVFDVATLSWANAAQGAPVSTTATQECRLVIPFALDKSFSTGTSTASTATTVTATKTWTASQWINYQIRMTSGPAKGQRRTITANTGVGVVTVGTAFSPAPTAGGGDTFVIEGNEDHIYWMGNNGTATHRYVISTGAAWGTMTARGNATASGMSANWCGVTGDSGWSNEADIKDGRFIYSLRGGTAIDRYDIAANTWVNGIAYVAGETFGAGSSACMSGRYMYIRKDGAATGNRFFKFSVRGNYVEPISTNMYTDGAAVSGKKMWVKDYDGTGTVKWLYSLQNTGTALHRLMLY